jgi:nucleoside-diphosphate-sugar epimerase
MSIVGTRLICESDVAEPLNLGSSELVTIDQLVSMVEEIAGIRLRRHYNLNAPRGVCGRNSDNTRIRHELNWEPSLPLREGMARTYRWIAEEMARTCRVPVAALSKDRYVIA